MQAFPSIKRAFSQIKQNKIDYLFLFFQFVVFSDMFEILLSNNFLLINLFLCSILTLLKNRRVNLKIVFVLLLYFLICLIPIFKFGIDDINPYFGFAIRLIIACLIVDYYRHKFVEVFETLVFVLAFISIPLYIIQLINPHFYDIFTPLTKSIVMDERMGYPANAMRITMHQYLFVYVLNGWGIYRNSGFMWEPAAFGAVLSWAILFNFFRNNFKYNNRLGVLLIAALSTFSLGTYFYLICLAVLLLYKRNFKYVFLILILGSAIYIFAGRLPFFQDNIEMINENLAYQSELSDQGAKMIENNKYVDRIGGFYLDSRHFIEWPLGFGFSDYNKEMGINPNGLMAIIVRWGIWGIIILLISSYKLAKYLSINNSCSINMIGKILTMIIFLAPFSGNPFSNQLMVLTLIILPLYVSYLPKRKPFLMATRGKIISYNKSLISN